MPMTFRPSKELATCLQEQATREGRSMQAVLNDAAQEYIDRRAHTAAVTRETTWAVERYADLLRELADR
jgi:predicted transcriptional regulator